MTPAFIERLALRLRASGITACEYEKDGARLRLCFGDEVPTEAHAVTPPGAAGRTPALLDPIRARATGRLHFLHPSRGFDIPPEGAAVTEGQIVGFLGVGEVLSALTAHRAGVLGRRLAADGELVGFGQAVQELR